MAISIMDFYSDAIALSTGIEGSQKAVRRSSKIYDNAEKKFNALKDRIRYYNDKNLKYKEQNDNKEYPLNSNDIALLRKDAEEALAAFEQYKIRYNKKTNPQEKTRVRGQIAEEGYTMAATILGFLDEKEKEIQVAEVETEEDMIAGAEKCKTDLAEANESVHLGSDIYKGVMNDMIRYRQILDGHRLLEEEGGQKREIDTKSFSPEELEEMNKLIDRMDQNIDQYLKGKEEKDLVKNPKTAKRVDAMAETKDLLRSHKNKLKAIEAEMEKEPALDIDDLASKANGANELLKAADTFTGSKEYLDAKDDFDIFNKLMKQAQDVEGEYEFNSYQRRLFEANLNAAEKSIDKYLNKKDEEFRKDGKWDEKSQRRVESMRQAKNVILQTRKKIKEVDEAAKKEVSEFSYDILEQNGKNVSEELEKGSRALRVGSGSEEYKNGKKAYLDSVSDAKTIFKDDAYKKLTMEERQEAIDKLKESRRETEKYIAPKNKEGFEKLNANGKIRFNAMFRAHEHLTLLIDKLEGYQQEAKKAEFDKEEFEKTALDRQEEIKGREKKDGLDRTKNNASKEAIKALAKYGTKDKPLTENEKKAARNAIAALILDERISVLKSEKDRAKYPKSPKEYAKMVKKIAEGSDFKKKFPDSKLTGENMRKLVTDPKEATKAMKTFYGSLGKVNNISKTNLKDIKLEEPSKSNNKPPVLK